MATWRDLVGYIRSNYRIAKEEDGILALVFGVGNGRTQMVLVTRHHLMGGNEEWVQILSPIAEVGRVDGHRGP